MSEKITIRRAPHDKENPYFLMRRDTAQDHGISAEALGILTEVISRPDDWKVNPSQLSNRVATKRGRIYRILKELMAAGYVERIYHRDELGRVVSVEYVIHESPINGVPFRAYQEMGNQDVDIQHNTKDRVVQSKEVTKNTVAPKNGATARPSKLTNEQRERLQADGAAIAERVAAMERVSPDDFTSTADGMTNADTRAQPFEALKDEITAIWGWDNQGVLTNVAKMLTGRFKAGEKHSEYKAYQFDTPMTADDLTAWAAWYRRNHPSLTLPQKPETIAKSVGEYRATGQKSTGVQNRTTADDVTAPAPVSADDRAAILNLMNARKGGNRV